MRIRRAFLLVCMGLLTCSQLQRMLDLRQPPPRVEPPTLHDAHSWAAADPNPAVPPPAPPPPPPPPRTSPPTPAPPRPNILLIMADDAARDWISAYGGEARTPHIDSLAASGGGVLGVRFETVWAEPMCTPSRVQALTGQYPFRTGWLAHHDVPRWGGEGLELARSNATTWAKVLRERAGYATAVAGKWQLHHLAQRPSALDEMGFEEHCVWPGVEAGDERLHEGSKYWAPVLQTNGERRQHGKGVFGPDLITDFVVSWIARHAASAARPWLMFWPMLLCHAPITSTPAAPGKPPKAPSMRSMAEYMDKLVGRALAAVEDARARERTVVIFTDDHGSSEAGSIAGRKVPGSAKGQMINGGVHVPMLVRAPVGVLADVACARLSPDALAVATWSEARAVADSCVGAHAERSGRVVRTPIASTALLPSLVELGVGRLARAAPDAVVDGRSFWPLILTGERVALATAGADIIFSQRAHASPPAGEMQRKREAARTHRSRLAKLLGATPHTRSRDARRCVLSDMARPKYKTETRPAQTHGARRALVA